MDRARGVADRAAREVELKGPTVILPAAVAPGSSAVDPLLPFALGSERAVYAGNRALAQWKQCARR